MKKERCCSTTFRFWFLQLKHSEMLNFLIRGTDLKSGMTENYTYGRVKSRTASRDTVVYCMLQSLFDTWVATCLAISLQWEV